MSRFFAKKGKIIAALALAVGILMTNTGCSVTVGDLVDAVTSSNNTTEEVTIKGVSKFLDAIKPNTDIVLKEGEYDFASELKKLYGADGNDFNKSHKYVKIETTADGYQIIIENVKNLTIEAKKNTEIVFENSSACADLISFAECENVKISGIDFKHTRNKDGAFGDVLSFKDCTSVEIKNSAMYGADGYGLNLVNVSDLSLTDSEIYNCKSGIMTAQKSTGIKVKNCKMYDCNTMPLKITGSEITFEKCEFRDNSSNNDYLTKSDKNNIAFEACVFATADSKALDYGTVSGDEGYTFDDECIFEEVLDGDDDGNQIVAYEEYRVTNVEEFFDSIGPNRTIIMEEGDYDITEFLDDLYDVDHWADKYEYIDVWSYYSYYEVDIEYCDNLTIMGEGTVRIISSSEYMSDTLCFDECKNISINKVEFVANAYGDDAQSFLEFYYCTNGDINMIKSSHAAGYGIDFTYCYGSWYIYDSEFSNCEGGSLYLANSDAEYYFDGCSFKESESGFNIYSYWSTKNISFKNCYFDYIEWLSIQDVDNVVVTNCTHEEPTVEYALIEQENLEHCFVDSYYVIEDWKAYYCNDNGEITAMPYTDNDGTYRFLEIDVFTDFSGYIYGIADSDEKLSLEMVVDDSRGDIDEVTFYVTMPDGSVEEITGKLYYNDYNNLRMQIFYNGIYYLLA